MGILRWKDFSALQIESQQDILEIDVVDCWSEFCKDKTPGTAAGEEKWRGSGDGFFSKL